MKFSRALFIAIVIGVIAINNADAKVIKFTVALLDKQIVYTVKDDVATLRKVAINFVEKTGLSYKQKHFRMENDHGKQLDLDKPVAEVGIKDGDVVLMKLWSKFDDKMLYIMNSMSPWSEYDG